MTTTLALAARLRALPDDELVAALRARPVRRAGISDFFDLAEALLDPDNLVRAIAPLDRLQLAALIVLGRESDPRSAERLAERLAEHPATAGTDARRAAATLATLSRLLLVHPADGGTDGGAAPYEAVTALLDSGPQRGLPRPDAVLATAPPPVPVATTEDELPAIDRLAAERAFEAVASVSELLAELGREGARELQKGGLALPAAKRLAEALAVESGTVPTILDVADRAGLAAVSDGVWLPTAQAAAWQHATTPDRWRALAAAWLDSLPGDLSTLFAARSRTPWDDGLRAHIAWLYPASAAEAQERIAERVAEAEFLGLTARRLPSGAGTALLESGPAAATEAMVAHFPAEVSKVYLQHDLTVISPGPLAPEVESRLRTMADLESRALASTFRFSAASVDRAVTAGETAASIHEFLAAVSLTGVPQPLDYLIAEAVARHGRVRVRAADDGHALVRSDDAMLLGTIAVDQALSSLRLLRVDDTTLSSRFPRDVVFWALSDARYPVVAENASGAVVTPQRRVIAERSVAESRDPAAELVARLRQEDAADEDTAEQWLARQLDQAVRARQTVIVQVAMPDGRLVDYLLEPTGIGGGRLRGRDRAADIERTLPLSSVKGLRSVD
ncbi:helicase-associated domain-containing protein [Leifsonia shinshuensis]|uniref:helicase-associated domain-containing protein n=1 Tax=Leifsonia shinshuensis TaxID=150026 RepID=UPI001F50D63A|nr:helicase-associated domain-containing protein [Leifsonia shinshuensis]MCI0156301.1 helicase-associated domain-containing protein [Leifsonia shinshuensis]